MAATKKKNKIPTPTTENGYRGREGHVSLAREEYDALVGREEVLSQLTNDNAKLQMSNISMAETLSAQTQHLSNYELKVMHLERINALQGLLLAGTTDKEKLAKLEDLSEFWRQWTVNTANGIDKHKITREEVAGLEPDLFKTWRNWVADNGRTDRKLSFSGSRAEREAQQPATQRELQEHLIRRQREENSKLRQRIMELEAETAAMKVAP